MNARAVISGIYQIIKDRPDKWCQWTVEGDNGARCLQGWAAVVIEGDPNPSFYNQPMIEEVAKELGFQPGVPQYSDMPYLMGMCRWNNSHTFQEVQARLEEYLQRAA